MAEIRTWPAIAKRLDVSIPTARKLWERDGLPIYRRNRRHGRQRWCWATTDELILVWQLAKSRVDRADALGERARRRLDATVPEGRRLDG